MDRLIWVTWRAFWIGLGASAVLILQALLHPTETTAAAHPAAVAPGIEATTTTQTTTTTKSATPILSRNPFDSKTGPLVKESRPPRPPRGA